MATSISLHERGKKRSREEQKDPSSSASLPPLTTDDSSDAAATAQPQDSIANFLALHSPPTKLQRTSLPFITRHPPPTSHWPTLPTPLIPLITAHLSSWRDLLRLTRTHRTFHTALRQPATAAACWHSVGVVRLSVLGADWARAGDRRTADTWVTINDRFLDLPHRPPGAGSRRSGTAKEEEEEEDEKVKHEQRVLFGSLRFVPRLSWNGDVSAPATRALFTALHQDFAYLRHLRVHSLAASGPLETVPYMHSLHVAFRSLVSLSLDHTYRLFVFAPGVLLPLSIRYLAAPTGLFEALLASDHLQSSPLGQSLTYVHCHGSTHWLSYAIPSLPNLQHVHTGQKAVAGTVTSHVTGRGPHTGRPKPQRWLSHKRPAAAASGDGSSGSGGGGDGSVECGLVSYAVRQSEEWLHARLVFPSLVCLSLQGKELLELHVLLTLAQLPSLRQLTLSRRAAWSQWHEDRTLPLASSWLPQLTTLSYLDLQCSQSIDTTFLTDLLFTPATATPATDATTTATTATTATADADAAMATARSRLAHLGLQLPVAVDEESVRGWRLGEEGWPALQQCWLAWSGGGAEEGGGGRLEAVEVRNGSVTVDVVGVGRACGTYEQLLAARVDKQWLASVGVEECK